MQENERAAALAQQLRALNESSANGSQLAAQYPAFQRYERNGLTAAVRCFGASELPPPLIDWALGLTRHHMAVSQAGRSCRGSSCPAIHRRQSTCARAHQSLCCHSVA
jgi:hypothetical protein